MSRVRRQLGVFGGSFDPPHLGHLIVASEACWLLGLEEVLFVPAGDPPHKVIAGAAAADRVLLTQAAVAGEPRFRVSTLEIDRGLRYTVDTLAALRDMEPQADLHFIAGSDSLLALHTWRQPERLLSLCRRFVVALRPGDDKDAVQASANRWGAAVSLLPSVEIGISSTDVRERLRSGRPVRFLVPDAVERLIAERGWYLQR